MAEAPPVAIADGQDVAEGTTTDEAWTSGPGTIIALLKAIVAGLADVGGGGGGDVVSRLSLTGTHADVAYPEGTTILIIDLTPQEWEPNTEYYVGSVNGQDGAPTCVIPIDGDGSVIYKAVARAFGTSGAIEPTWPDDGSEIVDNEIRWSAVQYGAWGAGLVDADYNVFGGRIVAGGFVWTISNSGASGMIEPDWATAPDIGDSIADGDYFWNNQGSVTTWAANHDYYKNLNDTQQIDGPWVLPTAPGGYVYQESGTMESGAVQTSGAVEPTWPVVEGHMVTDEDIVWQNLGQNNGRLTLTGLAAPTTQVHMLLFFENGSGQLADDGRIDQNFSETPSVNANRFYASPSTWAPDEWNIQTRGGAHLVYYDSRWHVFNTSGGPD